MGKRKERPDEEGTLPFKSKKTSQPETKEYAIFDEERECLLWLAKRLFGEEEAEANLINSPRLTCNNNIGDEGWISLARISSQLNKLTTLDLSGNGINDEGAKKFATLLQALYNFFCSLRDLAGKIFTIFLS